MSGTGKLVASGERNYRGHLALLAVNIIFGLNIPISKTVLSSGYVDPLVMSFFRMTGATVLFWLISIFTRHERVPFKDILLIFFASLLGIQINQVLFFVGLEMTSPIDASIITTLTPIFTMVFAALFAREPITWKKALGVALGMAGAIIIITSHHSGPREGHMLGNIFCILSGASYALYLSLFRGLIMRYSPVTLMKWMFLFAAICTYPVFRGAMEATDFSIIPTSIYLRISFTVIFATFIAYFLIPVAQKKLRPTLVSMYNYLQPFVSSLAAVALGLGVFGWYNAAAAILIFTGVYFVAISKSRAQVEAEKKEVLEEKLEELEEELDLPEKE